MRVLKFGAIASALLLVTVPAHAQSLQQRVETMLHDGSPGTRFGLVVADESGKELVAINPEQRFIPASNTKMVTTVTAFAMLSGLDQADPDGGTAVRIEDYRKGPPDVVIEGHGDAWLSGAADCTRDCLATLADAVAAKTKRVNDVIGDDSLYPDERWSRGMAWNNIQTRSGTATSALTIDDNELAMTVTPGALGAAPTLALPAYYTVDNRATTVAGGKTRLSFDREPNTYLVRLTGTIAVGAKPEELRFGIDDPARYAAWQFKGMLEARGVKVTGMVGIRHRLLMPADDPAVRGSAPAARPPQQPVLARITPPPLIEDLTRISKVSQNLHAELMLRRVSRSTGSGSVADGLAVVRQMLAQAGVPRVDYDFSDGSGMSTYNRLAPRGVIALLRWVAAQPWGMQWRATLPIGGEEGTLGKRFRGTALEGKLFAKTGTLNATNGLSGYMIGASGKTLTFSFYANDVPQDEGATGVMDKALVAIAAEN
ncbi:D-alanyl-D-alanine carboxypeptidase/D-alanyl-D-alanine-endopeptidase [Sphingomonas sp. MMS24-J13]|uniref:D-alanyl-D-alanine carboxypeptidase/D-alanyl-D-alanine endopeptidase n=1 Tax=Sphingomonas sp. MMS24-J13 TaxID=3238686 RepID=UPI00384C4614